MKWKLSLKGESGIEEQELDKIAYISLPRLPSIPSTVSGLALIVEP